MNTPELIEKLNQLNLQGVTISAQIDAHGNLLPVAGSYDKLLIASQKRSLPRIHTIVVPPGLATSGQTETPDTTLRILPAATIEEAVHLLLVDQQTRWGVVPDYGDILRRHRDFVGRQWLSDLVSTAIDRSIASLHAPAYILISGSPGTGKTAFVANRVRHNPAAVYHFLHREGEMDNPDVMLRSLTNQLRRIHALATLPEEEKAAPASAFYQVLHRASQELQRGEPGERQVIWIDGLDEAFGPTGRFSNQRLDQLLPLSGLPPRTVIVLTSRYEGPLDWFEDPLLFQRIDLNEKQEANLEDIREYLFRQNEALGLNLERGFLMRLAEASEGCFIAAVRYLHPGPNLQSNIKEWKEHPEKIPAGLDGWLNYQWKLLLAAGQERGIPERAIYGVLGFIAYQEGITTQEALFRSAPRIILSFLNHGDWERYLEPVLELSIEFFEPVKPAEQGFQMPRFFHSRFAEFIREEVQKKSIEPVFVPNNTLEEGLPANPVPGLFFWISLVLVTLLLAAGAWLGVQKLWPPVALATPVVIESFIPPSPEAAVPVPTQTPTENLAQAMQTWPTSTPSNTPFVAQSGQVSAQSSALHLAPVGDAAVILTLARGNPVQIFGRNQAGDWLAVLTVGDQAGGDRSGWVNAGEVELESPVESLPVVLPVPTLTPTGNIPAATPTATRTKPPSQPAAQTPLTDTPPPPPTPYP